MLLLLLIIVLCNKAQWKNRRTFLKFLGPITGHLLSSFIYLFIYAFDYLFIYLFIYLFFNINKFLLTTVNDKFL